MTGNYVDTTATRPVTAPCRCPGEPSPHAEDSVDVRVRLGYGEIAIYRQAGWLRSKGVAFSNEDAKATLLALGVVRWNLVLPDGSARPATSDEIARLDEATVDWLYAELKPATAKESLPKTSADRSPGGRSASDGHTRTTKGPKQPTST